LLVGLGRHPNEAALQLLSELRSDELLQNIRIVGDDLDNRSDIGGLINCAAIAGVDCYYQAKHIDCNVFDSRDVIVGSSGGIFAIPVRQNATWAKMPNFDLDKIKSRDRNRNPATFIIDDANDKKSQNQKYPARIYLLEGFTEHFYPEKRIILTGSTQDNPPSISLFDIDFTYPNIIIYVTNYQEYFILITSLIMSHH